MNKLPHRPGPVDPDPGPQAPPVPDPGERLEHGSPPALPEDEDALINESLRRHHKHEPA